MVKGLQHKMAIWQLSDFDSRTFQIGYTRATSMNVVQTFLYDIFTFEVAGYGIVPKRRGSITR
jgi:hypothetical protein